jgi:hypothetical protein
VSRRVGLPHNPRVDRSKPKMASLYFWWPSQNSCRVAMVEPPVSSYLESMFHAVACERAILVRSADRAYSTRPRCAPHRPVETAVRTGVVCPLGRCKLPINWRESWCVEIRVFSLRVLHVWSAFSPTKISAICHRESRGETQFGALERSDPRAGPMPAQSTFCLRWLGGRRQKGA